MRRKESKAAIQRKVAPGGFSFEEVVLVPPHEQITKEAVLASFYYGQNVTYMFFSPESVQHSH